MKWEGYCLSAALVTGLGSWAFWPGFHQIFLLVVLLWSLYFLFCLINGLRQYVHDKKFDSKSCLLLIAKWSMLVWVTAKFEFYFWHHEWGLVTLAFIMAATTWLVFSNVKMGLFRCGRVCIQFLSILVLCVVLLNISELQLVKWRYRKYPEFVQAFEFYQLDPNNPELQDQLFLEHQRIVLNKEDFFDLQQQMKRERRHKNQW
jgi:hypothetical protein